MIRSFCSADQLRRRSTVEIISDDMCLTVLKHVNKDSMIHLIPPRSARRQCHSPERTLTEIFAESRIRNQDRAGSAQASARCQLTVIASRVYRNTHCWCGSSTGMLAV